MGGRFYTVVSSCREHTGSRDWPDVLLDHSVARYYGYTHVYFGLNLLWRDLLQSYVLKGKQFMDGVRSVVMSIDDSLLCCAARQSAVHEAAHQCVLETAARGVGHSPRPRGRRTDRWP